MAYTVSTSFIEAAENLKRNTRAYIHVLDGLDTTIYDNTNLVKFKIISNLQEDTKVFGNALGRYCEVVLKNPNNNTYELLNQLIEVYIGFTINEGTVDEFIEYVKQGTFIVLNTSIDLEKEKLTLECYDSMINFNQPFYTEELSFPMTLSAFASELASIAGVNYNNNAFSNYDLIVNSPNVVSGKETLRQVLAWIAEIGVGNAFITRDNELIIQNYGSSSVYTITPDTFYEKKIDPQFGPIDSVIMAREPLNDNITYPVDLPENYLAFKLTNNQVGDETREDIVDDIYNVVNGFTYRPFKLSWRATGHLDFMDMIQIEDLDSNLITTYIMNHTVEYDGSVREELSAKAYTPTKTLLSNRGSLMTSLRSVEARVDQAEGEISLIVSDVSDLDTRMSSIVVDIDNITLSVEQNTEDIGTIGTELSITNSGLSVVVEGLNEQKSYYNYTTDSLTIGKSTSPAQIAIGIDGTTPYMELKDGGDSVATITSKTMQITDVEVINSIIFGAHKIKTYTVGGTTYTIVQKV